MNPIYKNYATWNEKEFLTSLGKWAPETTKNISRLNLLRGYQQGLQKRTNWNGMNKQEVERHVMMLIEKEVLLVQ